VGGVLCQAKFVEYEVESIRFGKRADLPWQLEGEERFERALQEKG
jgi:hypothetical protein